MHLKQLFVLTAALAGRTINLGDYSFVDGKCLIEDAPEQLALHARALELNWQALPENDPRVAELNEAYANVQREVPEGADRSAGPSDVHGDSVAEVAPAGGDADLGGGADEAAAGEAGSGAEAGDGSASSVKEPEAHPNEKLARAIQSLDPANDAHWTADGRPAMKAVEAAYGSADVTRADVDAAAPGYTREQAAAK